MHTCTSLDKLDVAVLVRVIMSVHITCLLVHSYWHDLWKLLGYYCSCVDLPAPSFTHVLYTHTHISPHTHIPHSIPPSPTHMLTLTHSHVHRAHWYEQVTVAGMLSLAYSPETHWYLAKPHIIEGVIETCDIQRTNYQVSADERALECLLLKYVSLVSAMCIALIQSYWLFLVIQLHTKEESLHESNKRLQCSAKVEQPVWFYYCHLNMV